MRLFQKEGEEGDTIKRSWIKLYLEILDDDEFGELPEFQKWRAIELFLVAGENGDDGLLPPVARLAWRLRLDEVKLAETLSALTQVGVVHETPEGWKVTHFEKRQERIDGAERTRLYRERLRESDGSSQKSHKKGDVDVSLSSSSTSSSVSVSPSDSEERGTGGETGNVFTVYEHNIGVLTPMIADALKDAEDTYGPVWVCAAIQEAVASNARSWKYCEAILKRWSKDGFQAPRKGSKSVPEDVAAHNKRVIEELSKEPMK